MARRVTVVVVDDSMTARKWTSLTLRQLRPQIQVIEAANGDEAAAAVESNEIDALIVDLNMPDVNGFELCDQLSALAPGAHLAIVTANVQQRIQSRAAERGYQFIAKPVNKEKLAAFVEICEARNGKP